MNTKYLHVISIAFVGLFLSGCLSPQKDKIESWNVLENALQSSNYINVTSLVKFQSKAYRAKRATVGVNGVPAIRADVLDPNESHANWKSIDEGHLGLNVVAGSYGSEPELVVLNNKLYILWEERGVNCACFWKIHIKVFNGDHENPQWTSVDGNLGSLFSSSSHQMFVTPHVFKNKLYLTFHDDMRVRVALFNSSDSSPVWTLIDNGGVNYNLSDFTGNNKSRLISSAGTLYIAWGEHTSGGCCLDQVRVKQYNGDDQSPTWTFIDGAGLAGLNQMPNTRAGAIRPFGFNNDIYLSWIEEDDQSSNKLMYISRFNIATGTWILVESRSNAAIGDVFEASGQLYLVLEEGMPNQRTIRVSQFGGGSSFGGLIGGASRSASNPFGIAIDGHMLLVWTEDAIMGNASGPVTVFK